MRDTTIETGTTEARSRGMGGAVSWLLASEALYLVAAHAASGSPHGTGLGRLLPVLPPWLAAWVYAGCLFGSTCLLAAALRRIELPRALVFGAAAVFGVTLLLVPAVISTDLMDDMGHGRVLAHYGANPYKTPASTFPPDAMLGAMGRSGSTPLAGPAWISIASLLALAGGGAFTPTLLGFKVLFLGCHLLNGGLILSLAARWQHRPWALSPTAAAAFYLWNPLVLTQGLAEGHHHVAALTCLLLAAWLLERQEEALGWGCAALACLVDYMMAPLAALMLVARGRALRAERGRVLAGLGLAAVVCVVAYAPYLNGFPMDQLRPPYWLPAEAAGARALYEAAIAAVVPTGWQAATAGVLWGGLVAGLLAWWIRAAARTREPDAAAHQGAAILMAALLSGAVAFELPAIGWVIALAAAAGGTALRRAALLLSAGAIAVQALGLHRVVTNAPPETLLGARAIVSALAAGVPILYLALHARRRRLDASRPARPLDWPS